MPDAQNLNVSLSTASVLTFAALGDYIVAYSLTGAGITSSPVVVGAGATILASNMKNDVVAPQLIEYLLVRVTSLTAATLTFSCGTNNPDSSTLAVASAPASSL